MDIQHSLSSNQLVTKLQALTEGLYYQSESDYPLEVVQFTAVKPHAFTKEDILALTGNSIEMPVEVTDLASFFRRITKLNQLSEKANSAPDQVATLQVFCEQQLQDVKVYRLGSRTITALLLGKTPEGKLLGLKSTIIET